MMGQRFLVAISAGLMLEIAAGAIAGLFLPGTEPLALLTCGIGLLLAAGWPGGGLGLSIATGVAAGLAALAEQAWLQGHAVIIRGGDLDSAQAPWKVPNEALIVSGAGCVIIAALCGWMLFRARQPWPVAALIASCLLLRADVSTAYGQRFPWFMVGVLLVIGISFAGRFLLARLTSALILAPAAVLVGWVVPVSIPAWSHNFVDPLRSIAVPGQRAIPSMQLALTGAFHPSNQVVMVISTDHPSVHPYWREATFDQYDGHAWEMTSLVARQVAADRRLDVPEAGSRKVLARVLVQGPVDSFVFPGDPLGVDRDSVEMYRQDDNSVVDVRPQGSLRVGDVYTVLGQIASNQATGQVGPIINASSPYLQLPPEPPGVRALARHWARGGDTVSKILRIQWELADSGKFTYDARAGSPANRDAVSDFLFNSHRGYCDQFATAMAVMLRALGIPSRLVTGYATGQPTKTGYIVRQKDAHSWVEAYVSGTGWLSFEPTPGFAVDPSTTVKAPSRSSGAPQPVVRQSKSALPTPVPLHHRGIQPVPVARQHRHAPSPTRDPLLVAIAILLGLAALGGLVVRARPHSIAGIYRRTVRSRRAGGPIRGNETPGEFAARAAPGRRSAVETITRLYEKERYAGQPLSNEELTAARTAWRSLQRRPSTR
jgi:transglutaminase-like putative cysteine protease